MAEAYIVEAVRTAGGKRGGALKDWHPADMAAEVLDALVERSGIDPAAVEDVIMGCVGQAGEQAFHIGRNAVLASKLPISVPAVTIDRQCGSSQQALQFAAQAVMSGTQDVVIASGVESMTRVPMGLPVTLPMQHGIGTGPFSKRIQDRFGVPMFSQFVGAEMIAEKYQFRKGELDAFALESHRKAARATEEGAFADEIVALPVTGEDGETRTHDRDEGIRYDATLEGIASVKLLKEGGRISAANASQICDGASGVLVVSERALKAHGLKPLARVVNLTVTAGDPVIMLEEVIPATARALAEMLGQHAGAGARWTAHLSPLLRDPGKKWAERDRCSRFPFVSVQRDARSDVPADQHDLLAGGKHRLPRRAAIIVGVDDQSGALGTSDRQQLRAGSSRIVLIEDGDVSVTTCERPNQPPVSAP